MDDQETGIVNGDIVVTAAVETEGQSADPVDIEQEVEKFCEDLKKMDLKAESNPRELLGRITDLMKRYEPFIDKNEVSATGKITTYRIRQGTLLLAQKTLVKKLPKKWTEWFKEEYGQTFLRSAQDYMRIAKKPDDSMKYAAFGVDRLTQIVRQIKKSESKTPIGQFLKDNGIRFNPSNETGFIECRIKTDVAIAKSKLAKHEIEGISDDKLKDFITGGHQVNNLLIENLIVKKGAGDDLNEYLEQLVNSEGRVKRIHTPETKAQSYSSTLKRFLTETESALSDGDYLAEVDIETYERLKNMVAQLESKFVPAPTN